MNRKAFTLIELLIVVAIIAILAAIAVPNFLEAQVRAKVSRAKADMRSMATALETYAIDWNLYPYDGYNRTDTANYNYWFVPKAISTPTAYMTTQILIDPFRQGLADTSGTHWQYRDVRYICSEATWGTAYDPAQGIAPPGTASTYLDDVNEEWGGWRLVSVGPDMYYGPSGPTSLFPGASGWEGVSDYPACPQPYDATNGSISWGDIMRSQKSPNGYTNAN